MEIKTTDEIGRERWSKETSKLFTDVPVYVCNHEKYGYLSTPLEETQTMEDDYAQLLNLKVEASGNIFHSPSPYF